jgi:hypothetical protein
MAESNGSSTAEESPPPSSIQIGSEQNLLLRPQRGRAGKKGGGDDRINQARGQIAEGKLIFEDRIHLKIKHFSLLYLSIKSGLYFKIGLLI